ncbi:MAG TPA: hypothetical protein VFS54_00010 [Solirubrobacterales bacterium]|nr:hypothetical protein [Solirubrobacterales bacterium]
MRRLSALGAVVGVTIVLACSLTAARASATVLCGELNSTCGSIYPAGTLVKAELATMTTAVIETEIAKVTCLENKIGMKTTAAGGASPITVPARVSEFSFAQCTVPAGMGETESCTVKPVNLGATQLEQWQGFYEKANLGNGVFGMSSSSLGKFGFSVLCNQKVESINCTFTNGTSSAVTGGGFKTPATFTGAEKMQPQAGGKKCPAAEATYRFTWAVSAPAILFLEPK